MRRAAAGPDDLALAFSEVVPVLLPLAPADFFFSRAARNAAFVGSVSLGELAMPSFNHMCIGCSLRLNVQPNLGFSPKE